MNKDELRNWILFGGASVILTIGAIIFALGPGLRWATDTAVDALPLEFESQIGMTAVDSGLVRNALDDPERVAVLERIAKLLNDAGDARKYRITIVRDTVLNAFALPGGQLVLHSGLMAKMRDESELFAVLGHEAGHVKHRHSLKQVARQLGLYAGVSLVLGDAGGVTNVLAGAGRELVNLGHGRREEEEADDEGVATLRRLKLDQDGMVRLLEHLQAAGGVGNKIPEFISSHPNPANRIARIRAEIKALPPAGARERILTDEEWRVLTHDLAPRPIVPQ